MSASVGALFVVALLLGACGHEEQTGGGGLFEDRTKAAGITFRTDFLPNEQGERFKVNLYDHGSGIAVADADGDGRDDVYFCNQLGSNALYRNVGGGRFEDVTAAAGPIDLPDRISVSAAFGDYDNDGRPDLYVTTTRGGNALFHNEGGLRFKDVTEEAGVKLVAHSQSATFFDGDGDGDLDLLVSNTAGWTGDEFDRGARYYPGVSNLFALVASPREKNVYYENLGNGRFQDRTGEAGLAGDGWSGDTAVFDYDEDGDLDVALANMFGATRLYRNDGKGRFHDVAKTVLGKVSWGAVGCKAFDADTDGHLDLLLVDMHSDMWTEVTYVPNTEEQRRKYESPLGPVPVKEAKPAFQEFLTRVQVPWGDVVFGNTFFHALGGSKFEEISDRAGLETLWPWGIAAADFDGDGDEDVFLPSGMGWPWVYFPNRMLSNRGDATFEDVTEDAGFDPPPGGRYMEGMYAGREVARSSRCAVTADFDDDGRIDLLVGNFNDRPFLMMNRHAPTSWVGFRLVGTKSTRDAVGAVVRLTVGMKTLTRQVHAAGGYLAQSSQRLHFGLGRATTINRTEITWPDGTKQVIPAVTLGTVHRIEEPR
jgi:hypothetical protein